MGEMLQRSVDKIGATIASDPEAVREALGVPSQEEVLQMAQSEQAQDGRLESLETRVAALEEQFNATKGMTDE